VKDKDAIFSVVIDEKGAVVRRLEPGRNGYRKARKSVILRQRDAIERFQTLKKAGAGFSGTYSFTFPDTARTFAMLVLGSMHHAILDNLDRVLAYDWSANSSER
jgi:hypothetical protein